MRFHFIFLILIFSLSSPLVKSQDTIKYVVLTSGKVSGKHWVCQSAPNSFSLYYEFNDRGRGPRLNLTIKTDDQGMVVSRKASGVDYYKASVQEVFEIDNSTARWKNNFESGEKKLTSSVIYSAINSLPAEIQWSLGLALKSSDHKVEVLPSGFLQAKHVKSHNVRVKNLEEEFELYAFTGAGGPPSHAWFTPKKEFFAAVSSWGGVVRQGYEEFAGELYEVQKQSEQDYFKKQAEQLTQTPKTPVAFKNVTVFDAVQGKSNKSQAVVVENGKIVAVGETRNVKIPANAKIIAGAGKMLLPGLWDNHTHYGPDQGLYHLAAGVTNIKDLANALDLPETKKKVDNGELLGPEISVMSGFIDFAGPFAGPTGKIVKTLDEGMDAVNFYADRGYQQIKLYSSIPVDWVKPLAAQAHQRGMKVCGHVPSFMTATGAINDGYDQIIHMNMVMLNFLGDSIDTRSMGRFIKVGERAGKIDLTSPSVKDFIALLKTKKIVVDPTLAIFEGMFLNEEGKLAMGYESIANRFPAEFKRSLYSGGLPTRKGHESEYFQSFDNMLKMLKLFADNKITFVPGTDDFPGFTLHRELELYSKAGVPNATVLQSATYTSAQVAGKEKEFGSVEAGKKANLILVNGDPVTNISDIRKVEVVMKNGNLYDPKVMYQSYGFGF